MSPGPRALTVDAVVQISSAYWLRLPIGKLHNDRYLSLPPTSRSAALHRSGAEAGPVRLVVVKEAPQQAATGAEQVRLAT